MHKILLVGGNSAIGQALQKNSEKEFISLSRSEETLNLDGAMTELDDLGPLSGMVYFPGTINLKPFTMLKEEDYLNDFNVNVMGAVKVLKKVINNLKEANGASVVFVSSVAANLGLPYHASIAAAKSALEGLAKSLAAEYASANVCFNVVAPSLTNTPMSANLLKTERQIEANQERNPMKQIGTPDQIANSINFLLDAHKNWMTGQILPVDGGMNNLK